MPETQVGEQADIYKQYPLVYQYNYISSNTEEYDDKDNNANDSNYSIIGIYNKEIPNNKVYYPNTLTHVSTRFISVYNMIYCVIINIVTIVYSAITTSRLQIYIPFKDGKNTR